MTDDYQGLERRDLDGLNYVSVLSELNEFLKDDKLEAMIDTAIKCFAQPHLKPETAEQLLLQYQAASTIFSMLAVTYTTIKKGKAGSEDYHRKNIYYTAAEVCDKMAATLKYIVRRQVV